MQANRILGLDPGGTTGVCKYHSYTKTMYRFQLGPDEHHMDLWILLSTYNPDIVVCERFDYRPNQKSADFSPVEYIGVLKLYEQYRAQRNDPVSIAFQKQLKGDKGLWTDEKLKLLELYIPAKPHAMDATRQVLYFVTNALGETHWISKYGKAID